MFTNIIEEHTCKYAFEFCTVEAQKDHMKLSLTLHIPLIFFHYGKEGQVYATLTILQQMCRFSPLLSALGNQQPSMPSVFSIICFAF